MERSERYDPEDLEHLMLERGFDELLEEERAYALRHLEGRAEYERMRALLHHVREDKRGHAPMDADPLVREHVLTAFRAQQRPQWRIWLNSVGGFLLPSRPSMYWRPALALGTVAVLVLAALMTWNSMDPKENKVLAEVKQEKPGPDSPKKPSAALEGAEKLLDTGVNERSAATNAVTTTLNADQRFKNAEVADGTASTASVAKNDMISADEPARMEAPATKAAAEQTVRGYAQGVKEDHDTDALSDRTRERKSKETTVQASSPVPMADVAEAGSTQTYTEDDLLGLLRAAW